MFLSLVFLFLLSSLFFFPISILNSLIPMVSGNPVPKSSVFNISIRLYSRVPFIPTISTLKSSSILNKSKRKEKLLIFFLSHCSLVFEQWQNPPGHDICPLFLYTINPSIIFLIHDICLLFQNLLSQKFLFLSLLLSAKSTSIVSCSIICNSYCHYIKCKLFCLAFKNCHDLIEPILSRMNKQSLSKIHTQLQSCWYFHHPLCTLNCHFLNVFSFWDCCCFVTKLCLALLRPHGLGIYSPPGSSVHGIFQQEY